MADPVFFSAPAPASLKTIAEAAGCQLWQGTDAGYVIHDVSSLEQGGAGQLSFFDNIKYKNQFIASASAACIIAADAVAYAPKGMNLLISPSPYKSYARAAQFLYPEQRPTPGISSHAHIDPTAIIAADCTIEAGAVIGPGVSLGQKCWVEAHAVIGRNVTIGDHGRIGPHASLSHAVIGHHVRLYPGVRIGQDGFGFAADAQGHIKIPQLGRVLIGNHVEIGANTAIDRGAGPDTIIGDGTWIDNLVQIGHNVRIGKGCIIVSQVGISGSTVIEDYAALGGQVGVAGHLRIGKGARIAAQSGIMRDVPAGEEQMGYPAMPIKSFMRQVATLNRLIKKNKSS